MKKKNALSVGVLVTLMAAVSAQGATTPDHQSNSTWYMDGQAAIQSKIDRGVDAKKAKNIILFIGDGMGISTVTAARIFEGQNKGMYGEENMLSFDKMPYTGLSKVYNTNQQTPDSAGTMTAMISGVKTKAGVIGVSEVSNRATCGGKTGQKGQELITAIELAKMGGRSTGVVTTARLTHATPAATYAKSSERNWESDDKLTAEAKKNGCTDIATQFVESDYVDVAFGGGRRHFIPNTTRDLEGKLGKRQDGKDLRQTWQIKTGGAYVEDKKGFDAIPNTTSKVLGLFNSSHMSYEADRKNDKAGEPSLSEMTAKAIDLLDHNKEGFLLVVEAGRIDHAHHAGSAFNALTDTVEYSDAVQTALDKTSDTDTLIIVTADHSHVFNMAGYPTRGNPILGKVIGNDDHGRSTGTEALAEDGMPYTTLSYTNGLGLRDYGHETDADKTYDEAGNAGRKNLTTIDTRASGYHQEALVPLKSETHAGEDVPIYASGPGAQLVSGTNEQNVIFHIMDNAGELSKKAEKTKNKWGW